MVPKPVSLKPQHLSGQSLSHRPLFSTDRVLLRAQKCLHRCWTFSTIILQTSTPDSDKSNFVLGNVTLFVAGKKVDELETLLTQRNLGAIT